MSMKKTIEHLRSELQSARVGARSDAATLDDLLAVVLRMDQYTMTAATGLGIEPEQVTEAQREAVKRAAHRAQFDRTRVVGGRVLLVKNA